MVTDEALVDDVRTRDKNLYAEVVKRYQDKLLRYTTYLLHDKDRAEDIVQETLIKAYINLNSFNSKKKFSSWIYRIAHNEAMNMLHKNQKELRIGDDTDFDSGISIEDDFSKKELLDQIHSCIDKMPTPYGEPLVLFYFEEKSYEEISDILRIPIGTVGARINRAKALMKKICQGKI